MLHLLEFLASAVTIYMTILQLGHGSQILELTDSSSMLVWMHKALFDPLNAESHDAISLWLVWTLVSIETSLYSQHIKGTENIIADYLSRDLHMSDQTLKNVSTESCHHRQWHSYTSNSHPEMLSPIYHI